MHFIPYYAEYCYDECYPVGYLLIWQPCNNYEHKLQLYPPLSEHFDHLNIKVKIAPWPPPLLLFKDLLTRIQLFIDVYIKTPFGDNLYLYVL